MKLYIELCPILVLTVAFLCVAVIGVFIRDGYMAGIGCGFVIWEGFLLVYYRITTGKWIWELR